MTPIFKKGKKETTGNYWPVSLTLMPSKIMEQTLPEVMSKHMEDWKVIRDSHYGFTKANCAWPT